ncbi:MAG TPA: DUF3014 domain-containing protein [Steroidobacteraceae bacterium]|nr:DUF3014 domain-containing protein [Steroidobacteraceae bacterium]
MNTKMVALSGGAVVAVAAGLYYVFGGQSTPEPTSPTPTVTKQEPAIAHPIPDSPVAQALPALDGSDEFTTNELISLLGQPFVQKHLIPKDLVRHIVVTVDNLPRKKLAGQMNPVVPIDGQINDQGEVTTALSAAQYARYDEFIQSVTAVDSKQLAAVYFKLYPLFQEAYKAQGYPNAYFNDRLVAVIDHLIATPYAKEPVLLVNGPGVYQFADPALENLSAGQKAIVRMGPEHGAKVRAKLKEIRALVASGAPAKR